MTKQVDRELGTFRGRCCTAQCSPAQQPSRGELQHARGTQVPTAGHVQNLRPRHFCLSFENPQSDGLRGRSTGLATPAPFRVVIGASPLSPAPHKVWLVSSQSVQHAYSSLAQQYIDMLGSLNQVHRNDLALIDRHLGHRAGPVLDLGCGPGHLTGFLRSTCADVTGIDLVPAFITHAREAHPAARFEVGSLAETARPDGSVSGVLAWYSLSHLDPGQMDGVLAEIRRILSPGGALVVGFFDGPRCEPFEHRVTVAHWWPAEEMAHRLAKAGFTEVECLRRGQEGEQRPHAAIAAEAI